MAGRCLPCCLLPLLLIGIFNETHAQKSIADTSLPIIGIAPSYAFHLPKGDLAERFGPSSNIGLRAGIKLKNDFQFDLMGSFIFGNRVKNKDQLLKSLKTSRGYVLTTNGKRAGVTYYERGFNISLQVGRVFPVFGYNPNSGILLKAGAGFLQHNIRYETERDKVPQLKNEKKEYFDRRASGFTLHEFIGYQHYANNGVANFFIGFESFQGFTKTRRSYNADDMQENDKDRFDLLYGIRGGYILSIYETESKKKYFY